MSRLNKTELLVFVLTAAAGTGLHFLYSQFPCVLTALIAPVNESLWEHVKLLYWPCLLAGLFLHRRRPDLLGQRAFALLVVSVGMLVIAYIYHILLQGSSMLFDIGLYLAMTALFFLLPHLLRQPFWQAAQELLVLLAAALGLATLLFTFFPPPFLLFADLSGASAWATLPC